MTTALIIVAVVVCVACAIWCERAVLRVRKAIHDAPRTVRRSRLADAVADEAQAIIEQSEMPGGMREGWR